MIMRLETEHDSLGLYLLYRKLYRSSVIGHSGTQLFETSQNWAAFYGCYSKHRTNNQLLKQNRTIF